jgi:hypothetical protein
MIARTMPITARNRALVMVSGTMNSGAGSALARRFAYASTSTLMQAWLATRESVGTFAVALIFLRGEAAKENCT